MNPKMQWHLKKLSSQFLVSDIDRTIAFYTELLRFEIDFRYEDFYCGLVKDGWSIHIKSDDQLVAKHQRRNSDDLDIVFSIEGIDDLYENMKSGSIEIIQPLRDMPYGREFYIADPDGYRIAFIEAK